MSLELLKQKKTIQQKTFIHEVFPTVNYEIVRHHDEKGRFYKVISNDFVDETRYTSITTLLAVRPAKELIEWRNAVGEEAAKHISSHAAAKGTKLHDLCELYVTNQDINGKLKDPFIIKQFTKFKPLLDRIGKVKAVEKSLYSKRFKISGTVDCIAEFDGVLSIIDYKTSRKIKYEADIKNYYAQCCAYAIMVYEMYGIKITDIVILISVDDCEPLVYKAKIKDHFEYLLETIKMYEASNEI